MLNSRIDLHIHSTVSDGCWTPEEVALQAYSAGISLISLTDHDTIAGVDSVIASCAPYGIGVIPGVEMSSKHNGNLIHILGYGVDWTDPAFVSMVEANGTMLADYDDRLVLSLVNAGYRIDMQEYQDYTWDLGRGGWKSLNYLIDIGLCRDVRSFFDELFVDDLEATFPQFPPPTEVIRSIKAAGGVGVWAHPITNMSDEHSSNRMLLTDMIEAGVEGLECYSCRHDEAWTEQFLRWANENDLLITGGSDSHGGFVDRQIGVPELHLSDLRLGAQLTDSVRYKT